MSYWNKVAVLGKKKSLNLFPPILSINSWKKSPFVLRSTSDSALTNNITYSGNNGFTINYRPTAPSTVIQIHITGLKPNTVYTISCNIADFEGDAYRLFGAGRIKYSNRVVDGKFVFQITSDADGNLFTTTGETNFIYILFTNATDVINTKSDIVISNIMLLEGSYTHDTIPAFMPY